MKFSRIGLFATAASLILVAGLACGGDDDSSSSDSKPSSPENTSASASNSATTNVGSSATEATPAPEATVSPEATNSPAAASGLDRAEIDELVEAWLRAITELSDVFGSLSNPLEAAAAAGKLQDIGADMQDFAELSTSLSAEDSLYIHEKYGDRIAEATAAFIAGLNDASSSPLGAALAGAFEGLPMLGQ